jgi:hypothetical protein
VSTPDPHAAPPSSVARRPTPGLAGATPSAFICPNSPVINCLSNDSFKADVPHIPFLLFPAYSMAFGWRQAEKSGKKRGGKLKFGKPKANPPPGGLAFSFPNFGFGFAVTPEIFVSRKRTLPKNSRFPTFFAFFHFVTSRWH